MHPALSLCLGALVLSACAGSSDGGTSGASGSTSMPSRGGAGGTAPTSTAGSAAVGSPSEAGMPSTGGATASAGASAESDTRSAESGAAAAAGGSGKQGGQGGAPAAGAAGAAGAIAAGSSGTRNTGGGGATDCQSAFCEDFESGNLAPSKWTTSVDGMGNTASVQKAISAHGSYAAAFHYAGTRGSYAFALTKLGPALQAHHFGRANVLLSPALPDRHTELLSAGTTGFPKSKYLEVAGVGDSFQLTYVDLVGGGEDYKASGAVPGARWFCLEWEFNDAPDETTIFVDGTQVGAVTPFSLNGTSSGLLGGMMSEFGIGYRVWGAGAVDTPKDYYFDDLALDTKRVGCLPK